MAKTDLYLEGIPTPALIAILEGLEADSAAVRREIESRAKSQVSHMDAPSAGNLHRFKGHWSDLVGVFRAARV